LNGEREHAHRDRALERFRTIVRFDAIDDVFSEPTATDERREGRTRDDFNGGRADAAEDDGKRERPIDSAPYLSIGHAEAARGLAHRLRHARESEFGAEGDRRNCEERQRDEGRQETDSHERQHDREHGEARHDARHVDCGERNVAKGWYRCDCGAERYADGERDRQCGDGERDMVANVQQKIRHNLSLTWSFDAPRRNGSYGR
jgi:hypothetical protein